MSEDYFATIGVGLLRGREFSAAEAADPDSRVAIIDELMAKKLFPGRDALGQHVQLSTPEKDGTRPELEVVGIVAAHRHDILAKTPPERLYLPLARGFAGAAFLHVRLAGAPAPAVLSGNRAILPVGDWEKLACSASTANCCSSDCTNAADALVNVVCTGCQAT